MPTHVMQREETEPWKPVGDQEGQAQYGSTQPQKIAGGLYPCCIMWTPIHPITWFAPFVGHMGICDSSGQLHDWGGGPIRACHPREMMFGTPCRYMKFTPKNLEDWDAAIEQADTEYLQKMHCMVCGDDCHSHVARVLNILNYWGCGCHNKVELAAMVFFTGRHTNLAGFISTWMGFSICLTVFLLVHFL